MECGGEWDRLSIILSLPEIWWFVKERIIVHYIFTQFGMEVVLV